MFSNQRLKQRRQALGLSQSEIARQLDINRTAYNYWESGKTKPNQKNLVALAKLLEVDETYFESEYELVSKYLQLTTEHQLMTDRYVDQLLDKQNQVPSPLYSYQVFRDLALSAGPGSGFDNEYEFETVYSEKEFSGFDIATWITGDSMTPVYQNGEVALIRETGFDYDGAIYALVWNDSLYIKKLYHEKTGFRMVSLNDQYPDRFIPYDDQPRIVGKVIGHFMPVIGA